MCVRRLFYASNVRIRAYQVFPRWASAAPSTAARPVHVVGGEKETPSDQQAQRPFHWEQDDPPVTCEGKGFVGQDTMLAGKKR